MTLPMTFLWIPSAFTAALFAATTLPSQAETYQDWTATHFTSAQIAAGMASPLCDHDGDLCPNVFEYLGGTHPMVATSKFDLILAFNSALNEVTATFPMESDREDVDYVVMVSHDLVTWSPDAVFVCLTPGPTYHLNGHPYVKIGVRPKHGIILDSDNDGLSDYFEEVLVNTDPDDAFTHLGEILPGDDFDGDGTLNIDEENNTPITTYGKPATFDINLVRCALDEATPSTPTSLIVHTLLR